MSNDRNREPEGIPTGGRFAAETRSENVVALEATPAIMHTAQLSGTVELSNEWFDTIPEWPAGMPEPELNFGFADGRAETYVVVDGKMATFWTDPAEGTTDDTAPDGVYSGPGPWDEFDAADREAACEWGREVHDRIDRSTYGVMIEASHSPAVKDIILAQATGKKSAARETTPEPDFTDKETREAYIEGAQERVYRAQRELQQLYLIAAAQELREKHPEIDSFDFSNNGDEPWMDAAWDADGKQIEQDKLDAANYDVFRNRYTADFATLMTSDPIYVSEAIAFRPGV